MHEKKVIRGERDLWYHVLMASEEVTRLLHAMADDEEGAETRLMSLVYDELRRLAKGQMNAEFKGGTLQATALVHEAYIRLAGADIEWQSRGHFFATAARAMRRILVDHARAKGSLKRGGDRVRVEVDGAAGAGEGAADGDPVDLLALDQALDDLEAHDERKARVVMLRYFAGLNVTQTAEALGVSNATIKNDWAYARAWLRRRIHADTGEA